MAALFATLTLFMAPRLLPQGRDLLWYLAALTLALLVDAAWTWVREKAPHCAVSAGVSAAIVWALAPVLLPEAKLAGLLIGLVVGKQLWGGTGRNMFNPAALALLCALAIEGLMTGRAPNAGSVLDNGPLWWLALITLGFLPFAAMRPFASLAYAAGSALAVGLSAPLGINVGGGFALVNAAFFAFVLYTDPVTVTRHRLAALAIGFISGVLSVCLPASFSPSTIGAVAWAPLTLGCSLVLMGNALSRAVDGVLTRSSLRRLESGRPLPCVPRFRVKKLGEMSAVKAADAAPAKNADGDISLERAIQAIRAADVRGQGGAAYPAADKMEAVYLAPAAERHLVVNAVECDPGLRHDEYLLENRAGELAAGISLLNRLMGFASMVLAVHQSPSLSLPPEVRVCAVRPQYPAGCERSLLRDALGITLKPGERPSDRGVLVLNAQTVLMVYRAVTGSLDKDTRLISLYVQAERRIYVADARMGEGLTEVKERACPGAKGLLVRGGGAMQAERAMAEDVVTEKANFIGVMRALRPWRESPQCSRCGRCESVCPQALPVREMADAVRGKALRESHPAAFDLCLRCGSCSAACLAGRNLSAKISALRC
jgi:Pyruvate/2-oxoacid:ferredoxin oxidoreductase delta subunit